MLTCVVVVVALGIFGGSLTLIPKLGLELIPQMSQGEFNVEFKAEPGTPLDNTDTIIRDAQLIAATIPEIDDKLIIEPCPDLLIIGTAYLHPRKTLSKFT